MSRSEKAEIRREARARRRALDGAAQKRASRSLAGRLATLRLFAPGRRVAFYLANDGEIDPVDAMRQAARSGTLCLLPVIPAKGRRVLRFAPVDDATRFRPNRFGIDEPLVSRRSLLGAHQLDAVLLPLVAFDGEGNRLGMGGGFYDATLALRRTRGRYRRPGVVGLAHECQRVDRIAVEPWDIPLDAIVTDAAVYEFERSST